jgi:hypothetical protein
MLISQLDFCWAIQQNPLFIQSAYRKLKIDNFRSGYVSISSSLQESQTINRTILSLRPIYCLKFYTVFNLSEPIRRAASFWLTFPRFLSGKALRLIGLFLFPPENTGRQKRQRRARNFSVV